MLAVPRRTRPSTSRAGRFGAVALTICLLVTLLGAELASGEHAGNSAVVYVSPHGNDRDCVRGVPARACRTFGRGYELARPGDTVSIAGGTYPGTQELVYDAEKARPPAVKLVVARGARVVVGGGLDFEGASYVTVDGGRRMTVREINATMVNGHRPAFITIAGVHAFILNNRTYPDPIGGTNYFNSVDHLTLRDIEIGPTCCHLDGLMIGAGNKGEPNPSHIVLDRLYIHDVALSCRDLPTRYRSGCHEPDTDEHVDCLQFLGGVHVTIQNSRFFGCSTSNIMTGSGNDGVFSDWTIQNNLFGALAHPNNGVDITDGGPGNSPWSGTIRILHNTFANGPGGPALILAEGPGAFQPGTKAYIAGNAGGLSRLCLPKTVNLSVEFEDNMWGGFKCSGSDLTGVVRLVRPTLDSPDLRLRAGSPGIGAFRRRSSLVATPPVLCVRSAGTRTWAHCRRSRRRSRWGGRSAKSRSARPATRSSDCSGRERRACVPASRSPPTAASAVACSSSTPAAWSSGSGPPLATTPRPRASGSEHPPPGWAVELVRRRLPADFWWRRRRRDDARRPRDFVVERPSAIRGRRLPVPVTAMRGGATCYRAATRGRDKLFSLAIRRSFATFGRRSVIQMPVRLGGERQIAVGDDVFVGAGSWLLVLETCETAVAIELGSGNEHRRLLRHLGGRACPTRLERAARTERVHRGPHARIRGCGSCRTRPGHHAHPADRDRRWGLARAERRRLARRPHRSGGGCRRELGRPRGRS